MQKCKVSGMTCGHCAQTVTRAAEALPGFERALVDLDRGDISLEGEEDKEAVRQAVANAGYVVEERLPA